MKKLIVPLSLFVVLSSCSAESKRTESTDKKEKKVEVADVEEPARSSYFAIPSPKQMFTFINANGVEYNKSLVNDINAADNYTDPSKKALVFGVYTADLAYVAAYQDVEATLKLYKTVRKLSIDLQIEELMTDEMMENIQVNMENPDSLAEIAANSYYNAVEHLEDNGQEGKLALMSLGGWTESMFITMNAIKDVDLGSSAVRRIAAQKITFNNLYAYLAMNDDKLGVKEEMEKVQRIKDVFQSLKKGAPSKSKEKKGGKLVFGKGNKIQISIEQYLELKSAIEMYRSQIVTQNI